MIGSLSLACARVSQRTFSIGITYIFCFVTDFGSESSPSSFAKYLHYKLIIRLSESKETK